MANFQKDHDALKTCRTCGETLPETDFYKSFKSTRPDCIMCTRKKRVVASVYDDDGRVVPQRIYSNFHMAVNSKHPCKDCEYTKGCDLLELTCRGYRKYITNGKPWRFEDRKPDLHIDGSTPLPGVC